MLSPTGVIFTSSRPVIAVGATTLALVLGAFAGLDASRMLLLALVLLTGQAAFGLSGEWRHDLTMTPRTRALSRSVGLQLRGWAVGLTFASIALTVILGPRPALVNAVILAVGWSYSLWLRTTPASVLPPIIWYALLPLVVTLSRSDQAIPQWWVIGCGALIGIALHFAPWWTTGAHASEQVPALPRRLGRRASTIVCVVASVAALAVIVAGVAATGAVLAGPLPEPGVLL
jgi:hypothetical protein